MKKGDFFVLVAIILSILLIINSVFAEQGSGRDRSREKREIRIEKDGVEKRIEIEKNDGEERIKIKINGASDGEIEEISVKTELEIEEEIENGKTSIKAKLKDGRKARINVFPDDVLEKALEDFETDVIDISLEEENLKLKYKVKATKKAKFLGLFETNIKIESEIDPETGEVLKKRKPWWAFLVFGENSNQIGKKITICHVPSENPAVAHTITVGGPAVRAHLAHGDYLGGCAGQPGNQTNTNMTIPPGNNTNSTIPVLNNTAIPINNTNVTIPSGNETIA